MRAQPNRTRCRVCRQVPRTVVFRLMMFGHVGGWRTTLVLCRTCAKAIIGVAEEVRAEYR